MICIGEADQLKSKFSDLTVIHVTCPLTTRNYNFK
jgi:hypothetical protein